LAPLDFAGLWIYHIRKLQDTVSPAYTANAMRGNSIPQSSLQRAGGAFRPFERKLRSDVSESVGAGGNR